MKKGSVLSSQSPGKSRPHTLRAGGRGGEQGAGWAGLGLTSVNDLMGLWGKGAIPGLG